MVVLDRLDAGISVDAQNMTVTVSGGTRYGTLAAELQRQGFALHNLASLPHISVAGAVATATHGSGDRNGNLATAVAALELVTADGAVVTARRGDPDFDGMVVGLGALGIVSRLTLDIEPTFDVAQSVFEGLDWDQVLESFDDVTSSAYSVSLFTDWSGTTVGQAWLKNRDASSRCSPPDCRNSFRRAPATDARHPLPGVSGSNCTAAARASPGRGPTGWPTSGWNSPPARATSCRANTSSRGEHAVDGHPHHAEPVRRRSLPCSWSRKSAPSQPTSCGSAPTTAATAIGLHFTWRQDEPAVAALLPRDRSGAGPVRVPGRTGASCSTARPPASPRCIPRFADFTALAGRLDPAGKFRNAFLDRTVFGR